MNAKFQWIKECEMACLLIIIIMMMMMQVGSSGQVMARDWRTL